MESNLTPMTTEAAEALLFPHHYEPIAFVIYGEMFTLRRYQTIYLRQFYVSQRHEEYSPKGAHLVTRELARIFARDNKDLPR